MNDIKFVGRPAGRCATVYEREDLDQVLPRFKQFVFRNQNNGLPTKLEPQSSDKPSAKFQTVLGYGTYGVDANGTLTLLAAMIDSSD